MMCSILVALPLLTFLELWLLLVNLETRRSWRKNFLRSALLCGAWLVVSTELLSLGKWLTFPALIFAWALPAGVMMYVLLVVHRRNRGLTWHPDFSSLRSWDRILFVGLVFAVLLITALIACLAPPNEAETLHYRMARVAHWAQNRSIAHYPTAIEIQNSFSPGTEYAFLHVYILANGDRFVPLVSWFAILGCAVGVSLLAACLGAGVTGQQLAALFAISLPLAIVQATSTMQEGVLTFWVVCVAVEFLLLWQARENTCRSSIFFLSLGAGLGLVTKPLAAPFLLPFALATGIALLYRGKLSRCLLAATLAVTVFVLLNGGYLWRNYRTYRTWLDAPLTRTHSNEMYNWKGLLSNLLRNAATQASTPWEKVNYQITRLVVGVHFKLGIDVNDPRTTSVGEFWVRPLNTSDVTSQASLHAWVILLVFVLTVLYPGKLGRQGWLYQVLVLGGYLTFCYVFKWQIFGTRYLLPFFALYAPLIGIAFTTRWPAANIILGVGLLLAATPWLVSLQLRPIIPRPGTYSDSLLSSPREVFYFAGARDTQSSYKQIAEKIQESGCRMVGLYLSGASPEYLWWVALSAPQHQIRIEWLMAAESARYVDPEFLPCAIISDAGSQDYLFGLPLVYTQDHLSLYLGEGK